LMLIEHQPEQVRTRALRSYKLNDFLTHIK
jgi:hypothetical protein